MKYAPILSQENINSCVSRIKEEEAGSNSDNLIKNFLDLMTKLDIKIFESKVEDKLASDVTSKQYKIVICRKEKKIQTSFPAHLCSQPDLSDILLEIRAILLDPDSGYDFEEYSRDHHLSADDPSSKLKYDSKSKPLKH